MRTLVACMLCLSLLSTARAEPAPVASAAAGAASGAASASATAPGPTTVEAIPETVPHDALPLRARLDRDAIRAAIADLPEETEPTPRRHEADTLSATPFEGFSREFGKARLPVCLHAEGLRNQPTFFLNGWIALPFVAVAKLRGVCR